MTCKCNIQNTTHETNIYHIFLNIIFTEEIILNAHNVGHNVYNMKKDFRI